MKSTCKIGQNVSCWECASAFCWTELSRKTLSTINNWSSLTKHCKEEKKYRFLWNVDKRIKYKEMKKVKSTFFYSEYNFEIYHIVIKLYILLDRWVWSLLFVVLLFCFVLFLQFLLEYQGVGGFCEQINNFFLKLFYEQNPKMKKKEIWSRECVPHFQNEI